MDIDPTHMLARPTASPSSSTEVNDDLGKDAFMELLVAQLRNQDPLEPMDGQQMIAQLSELTGVEKLVAIEDRLGTLESIATGGANAQTPNLIGKSLTADTSGVTLGDFGGADVAFSAPSAATQITATVRNAQGFAVRTIQLGHTAPGAHQLTWDGYADDGARAPRGEYRFELHGTSESGDPVAIETRVTGVVQQVSYSKGYPELSVNGSTVVLGDVISIHQ